jgi:RimJ/RimL family protein N-acetyltransferase
MEINIQPTLETENLILKPLLQEDFDALYAAAADPKIWEQHPNTNRWQKEVFQNFFEGALQSKGAFKIVDATTKRIIGSTRFYDYTEKNNAILIGYTFYSTDCWGKGINLAVKKCMLDYIFQYVSAVIFHVGSSNFRSQIAMNRLGIKKVGEKEVAYFGEPNRLNFVYRITKNEWFTATKKVPF